MWVWVSDVVIGGLVPPAWAYVVTRWMARKRVPSGSFFAAWLCSCGGLLLSTFVTGDWWLAVCGSASLVACIVAWLWWRKRKDRAAKLAGAKSRALIAAMVRRAREAAQPRPVFRPVPGGAR